MRREILDFSAARTSELPRGCRENAHKTSYHWCIFHRRSSRAKARFARRVSDSEPSDSEPPPKRRGRPFGTTTTSIAIREGRQLTLSKFFGEPASTPACLDDAGAEQPSFAEDVTKSGSEPVPENLLTVDPVDDAAPSTLGGFRTASGCCPLCNELVGARARPGAPSKRRVLENANLGLKLRHLCRFPCLGWCDKKPKPCCTSQPRPDATCDNCYWVCNACYMKHYRAFKKPDSSDQTASTSASAVVTESAPLPPV